MDWIAFLVSITGVYLAGRKDPRCWVLSIFAQFIFIHINIQFSQWGLVALCIVHIILSVRNWWLWTYETEERRFREKEKED